MVLSLLPDRGTERERETGWEGRGSPRGSGTRKRAVLPKKTKFWGWQEWMFGFEGGWASALWDRIVEGKPDHNP